MSTLVELSLGHDKTLIINPDYVIDIIGDRSKSTISMLHGNEVKEHEVRFSPEEINRLCYQAFPTGGLYGKERLADALDELSSLHLNISLGSG